MRLSRISQSSMLKGLLKFKEKRKKGKRVKGKDLHPGKAQADAAAAFVGRVVAAKRRAQSGRTVEPRTAAKHPPRYDIIIA